MPGRIAVRRAPATAINKRAGFGLPDTAPAPVANGAKLGEGIGPGSYAGDNGLLFMIFHFLSPRRVLFEMIHPATTRA